MIRHAIGAGIDDIESSLLYMLQSDQPNIWLIDGAKQEPRIRELAVLLPDKNVVAAGLGHLRALVVSKSIIVGWVPSTCSALDVFTLMRYVNVRPT